MAKKILPDSSTQEKEAKVTEGRRGFLSSLATVLLRQREASIVIVAIVLVIYFQASNQAFLSQASVATLFQSAATTAIIATGEVMLLICGEMDLSAGMIYALVPFVVYFSFQAGIPIWIGIILALILGGIIGMVNGAVTVFLKVPSFITTLGMIFFLEGVSLLISGGFPKLVPQVGAVNSIMGHAQYAGIIWAVAIAIVMQIVLSYTRWGLHTVATGGNVVGASEVGINVNRIKIGNFILSAVLSGFAGILDSFRITSMDPLAGGTTIMFMAIAGAVIGGTALQGGLGTIVGAFLGVLVLTILQEGFTVLGVSAFTFDVILGIAILVAMVLNVRLSAWRERGTV
jgi:simple sugar transport system permease protein